MRSIATVMGENHDQVVAFYATEKAASFLEVRHGCLAETIAPKDGSRRLQVADGPFVSKIRTCFSHPPKSSDVCNTSICYLNTKYVTATNIPTVLTMPLLSKNYAARGQKRWSALDVCMYVCIVGRAQMPANENTTETRPRRSWEELRVFQCRHHSSPCKI